MRPLKLELNNFGSYQHETISFEDLGEKGLYLICGNTGAGKTTLFDAICYALFGVCSGSHKKPEMLRCQQAIESEPTSVSLSFSHKGELYQIKRSLPYTFINEKGKEISRKNRLEFTTPTETITKVRPAGEKITEILGLDAIQFKQIALIAQNQFLDLINARSEDRNKIFRELFDTQKYLSFQKKLSERFKLENQVFQSLLQSQNQIEARLAALLETESDQASTKAVLLQQIEEKLEEITKCKTKANEREAALQNKLNETNTELGRLKNQQLLVNQYLKARQDFEKAEKQKAQLDQKQQALESKKPEFEKNQQEYTLLYSTLSKYDQLESCKKSLNQAQIRKEKAEKKKSEIETEQKDHEQKQKINEALLAKEPALKLLFANNEKQLEKAKELVKQKTLLKQKEQTIAQERKLYQRQRNAYQKAFDLYQQSKTTFMDNLAGVLRADLKQGDLCPVCHHVIDAKLDSAKEEIRIDSKGLDKLEQSYKDKEQMAQQTSREISTLQLEIDHLNEKIAQLEKESENKDLQDLEAQKESLLKEQQEILQAAKEQSQIEGQSKILEKNLQEASGQLKDASESISSLSGMINQLKNELDFDSKADASNKLNDLNEKMDEYRKEEQDLQKSMTACIKKLQENEGFIKAHQNLEGKNFSQEIEALEKEKTDLAGQIKENIDREKTLLMEEKQIQDAKEAYEEILEQIEEKGEHITELEELCDAVNGNTKGNKIKLETYLQQYYFDQILMEANSIFDEISNHRYALVRKEVTGNKAMQGLDLAVADAFSEETREIKSLSGGESFKAALSLALGLSQSVSMQNGGFQCESMFIDEGFGNLDQANLEETIETLKTMAGSEKLIGIISHLSSLQDQIERKLEVSYSSTKGSKVKFVL